MKWLGAALLSFCASALAAPSEIAAEYQVTTAGVAVGRVKESFTRNGDTYAIRSVTVPEGVLKVLLDDQWELSSSGRVGPAGLEPRTFTQRRAKDGKRDVEATFDWARGVMVSTYQGKQTEVALPKSTQDRISVMYQFMNLQRRGDVVEIPMTNGRKIELYTYRFVGEERIDTGAGTFETLHYTRVTGEANARHADFWLAKERFNFPVRMVFDDPKGLRLEQSLVALQAR
jgi:hypothetical protein